MGFWSYFSFTSNTSDNSAPFVTTIPPYVESISGLLDVQVYVVLPIDNMLKVSATTLTLDGW